MKTLFVVSEKKVNSHVGEEYDSIMEVEHLPTTETIQPQADKVMAEIRKLWFEQVKPDDPNAVVVNPKVVVSLDAAPAFAAMLVNLQIIMKAQEGIEIELPWEKQSDLSKLDEESKEILRKLDERK
jgi:hypothetical protein